MTGSVCRKMVAHTGKSSTRPIGDEYNLHVVSDDRADRLHLDESDQGNCNTVNSGA